MAAEVVTSLRRVLSHMSQISQTFSRAPPTLVAVSKTKPVDMIQLAYDAGHRHFGENYIQELTTKAPLLPREIQWHFIGHLQTNKCKQLLSVPNLYMVESVDSERLATQLNKACVTVGREERLKVLVQINTSDEATKFGADAKECISLVKHVVHKCPRLEFSGLMTIGRLDSAPPTDCFKLLVECRKQVADELKTEPQSLDLSMGMSGDYELAIQLGSTIIRIGSTIFGARDYSKKTEQPAITSSSQHQEQEQQQQQQEQTQIHITTTKSANASS